MSGSRAPSAAPEVDPTARAARVAALRAAYLRGALDLRISPDARGLERLLHDLFGPGLASPPRA